MKPTRDKKSNIILIVILAFLAINSMIDAFTDHKIHQQLWQSDLELRQEFLGLQQEVLEYSKVQNQALESLEDALGCLYDQLAH